MAASPLPPTTPLDDRAVAARLLDTTTCPDCGTRLTGARCAGCRADLAGPTARELLRTSVDAATLLDRRAALRERLRSEAWASASDPRVGGADAFTQPRHGGPEHAPHPLSGQQVLLALGATLLAIAALVFTVVAWGGLGIAGRGAVLAGVTGAVWAAASAAPRRGLRGTGESLASLTAALLLLDAYAVRATADSAALGSARVYWGTLLAAAGTTALLAGRRSRLVAPSIAGALASAAAVSLLAAACPSIAPAAAVLVIGGLALVTLAFVARQPGASVIAAMGAAVSWTGGVGGAALAVETGSTAAGLAVLGVAAAGAAALASVLERRLWSHAALATYAAAALVLSLAALVAADALVPADVLPHRLLPALAATYALLLWLAVEPRAARVLRARLLARAGTRVAALVTAAAAAAAPLAVAAAEATDGLRATSGTSAYVAALVLVTVLLALGARAAGETQGRHARFAAEAGGVVTLAATLLLLVARLPLSREVTALVLLAAGLAGATAAGLLARPELPRLERMHAVAPALGAGALAAVGLGWAGEDAGTLTAAALLVLAASAAGWATWPTPARPVLAALATAAWTVTVWAGSTASGAPAPWAAAAGVAAAAGTAAAATLLVPALGALVGRGATATAKVVTTAQLTAALVALPALLAAGGEELPRSVALTLAGVGTAAVAVDPARRRAAWASGALLALASWSRLDGVGVGTVEAYTLPSALALLAVGGLRARRQPATSSWAAYGPGLTLALGPSLLSVLADDDPLRALLLAAGAGAVVLAGARGRLAAPLVLGGGTLLADALLQIGPVAAALPRWVVLGALGAVLLGTGATYERRLAQLRTLRTRAAGLR